MAEAAEAPPAATRPLMQSALSVDVVKQYAGQLQVDRRVIVNIPGKFFPSLTGAVREKKSAPHFMRNGDQIDGRPSPKVWIRSGW